MAGEFTDRIVVVTGGSRGIGFGIAGAFAKEGARTVLASSSQERLERAAEEIASAGSLRPDICPADLRTPEGAVRVHDFVASKHGRCDVLVNSAGATRAGAFLELTDETWHDGFALKFFGCVRLCRLFWPMLRTAQGHVVNVIGGAARTPDPQFLIGGSVNAAMNNFTKGLSQIGKRDGVNVNALLPGLTQTERVDQLMTQRAQALGSSKEEVLAQTVAKDGLRRIGTPEDMAAVALFLCSERARHIQGTSIAVDGGATPGMY